MPELRLGLNDKILFESTGRKFGLKKSCFLASNFHLKIDGFGLRHHVVSLDMKLYSTLSLLTQMYTVLWFNFILATILIFICFVYDSEYTTKGNKN